MKKHNTFKIRTLAIVLMTLSLTIIIGCATGQVKRKNDISSVGTIVVGNYRLKMPNGYVEITSSEVPPMIKTVAKELKMDPSEEGVYNINTGTVILFAYFKDIDQGAEYSTIEELESMIDKGELQDIMRKEMGKDFEQVNLESLEYSTTYEKFIVSGTISFAFLETSAQFYLKRNQHTPSKKGRIVAFALSRPSFANDSKLDVLNILNSAQEVL